MFLVFSSALMAGDRLCLTTVITDLSKRINSIEQIQKKIGPWVDARNKKLMESIPLNSEKEWPFFDKDYLTIGELGAGDSGTVYLAKTSKNKLVTHKSYSSISGFEAELKFYKQFNLKFPENSLKVIDSILIRDDQPAFYITEYVYSRPKTIFFEYVSGVPDNLWKRLHKEQIINDEDLQLLVSLKEELVVKLEKNMSKDLMFHNRHYGSFLFDVENGKMLFVDPE